MKSVNKMVKKILASTNPKLRLISKPVAKIDKKIIGLIGDLKDTLAIQKDPEGVGLAAPQIGKNVRIFVINYNGVNKTVINPKVLEVKKGLRLKRYTARRDQIMEGCLSLPHYYGGIKRPNFIKLEYFSPSLVNGLWTMNQKIEVFKDFFSQIVLHEIDHLNGILFIDRLLEQKKKLYKLVRNEWEEVELI